MTDAQSNALAVDNLVGALTRWAHRYKHDDPVLVALVQELQAEWDKLVLSNETIGEVKV